jgi:hypothetical protein
MHGGVKCGGWLAAGEQEWYVESMCGNQGACERLKGWWYECVGCVRAGDVWWCSCTAPEVWLSDGGELQRNRCQPGCLAQLWPVEVNTGFEKRIGCLLELWRLRASCVLCVLMLHRVRQL